MNRNGNIKVNFKDTWINPTGGSGDILMLSGVLKQCMDAFPQERFNVVRRAIYTDILKGHPAIRKYDYVPKNTNIITTDYWSKEKLGKDNQRPYQILARLFGLPTPIEEKLYLPGVYHEDRLLDNFILKDGRKIALIAPSSLSPRKMTDPVIWHNLVEKLTSRGIFVIQVGHRNDVYIKGSYSLLGQTTLRQLIALMMKSDVIISVDSLVMHAAHLTGKPAIIIWGPTRSEVYGYPGQMHIQCPVDHCHLNDKCLGPGFPENYQTPCPLQGKQCTNGVSVDDLFEKVLSICF